jgi:hypothetical protein
MSRRPRPVSLAHESFQGLPLPKTVTPESAVLDPRADAGMSERDKPL